MLVDGDSIDVRLMDFGVAQLEDRASITLDGDLVGTLAYMSPEQGEGKHVDSRSDVYSLALTLYEGFAGKSPFRGKKLQELLRDVSRPDIPPLAVRPPRSAAEPQRRSEPGRWPATATRARMRPRSAGSWRRRPRSCPSRLPDEPLATRVRQRGSPAPGRPRPPGLSGRARRRRGVSLSARSSTCCRGCRSIPRRPSCALVAVPTFLALVWPFAGGVLTLAVLAPPIFAYGAGWGVVYVVPAIAVMALLRWRRREWAALLAGRRPAGSDGLGGPGAAAAGRGPAAALGRPGWLLQRPGAGGDRRPGRMAARCPTPSPPAPARCSRAPSTPLRHGRCSPRSRGSSIPGRS